LREDQAAAALAVLTDGKRVSVINAPAGSGKTHVLAAAARAWEAAGLGPVIGITPSQSVRNTLAAGSRCPITHIREKTVNATKHAVLRFSCGSCERHSSVQIDASYDLAQTQLVVVLGGS
jgi:hypothetical protein